MFHPSNNRAGPEPVWKRRSFDADRSDMNAREEDVPIGTAPAVTNWNEIAAPPRSPIADGWSTL